MAKKQYKIVIQCDICKIRNELNTKQFIVKGTDFIHVPNSIQCPECLSVCEVTAVEKK